MKRPCVSATFFSAIAFAFIAVFMIPRTCAPEAQPLPVPAAVPAQTPVPDATQVPTPAPEAAAGAPAVPAVASTEVVPEAMTGPDITELEKVVPLKQSNDPKIDELFVKAGELLQEMSSAVNVMNNQRGALYERYASLDAVLDEFFQDSGASLGSLQEIIKPSESTNDQKSQAPGLAQKGTVASSVVQTAQNDLETLNKQLQTIGQDKTGLKELLAKMDSDIETAKTSVLQARKNSMEILNQSAIQGAQTIFDEIKKTASMLTSQQTMQAETSEKFQESADKIQTSIQSFQDGINRLKNQGVAIQATQIDVPVESKDKTSAPLTTVFKSWVIKESDKKTEARAEETFVHYLFARMADLVSGAAKVVYETYLWLQGKVTEWLNPSQPTPVAQPQPVTVPAAQQPTIPSTEPHPVDAPPATQQQQPPMSAAQTVAPQPITPPDHAQPEQIPTPVPAQVA